MSSMCGAPGPQFCGAAIKDRRRGEWHKCHGLDGHSDDHTHQCEDGAIYRWQVKKESRSEWETMAEVVSEHRGGMWQSAPA